MYRAQKKYCASVTFFPPSDSISYPTIVGPHSIHAHCTDAIGNERQQASWTVGSIIILGCLCQQQLLALLIVCQQVRHHSSSSATHLYKRESPYEIIQHVKGHAYYAAKLSNQVSTRCKIQALTSSTTEAPTSSTSHTAVQTKHQGRKQLKAWLLIARGFLS